MAFRVEISKNAKRFLDRLDKPTQERIEQFLFRRVQGLDNPRSIGEAMKGKQFGDLWKYRAGDWRIIARIETARLVVLVVKIGHRREVYR